MEFKQQHWLHRRAFSFSTFSTSNITNSLSQYLLRQKKWKWSFFEEFGLYELFDMFCSSELMIWLKILIENLFLVSFTVAEVCLHGWISWLNWMEMNFNMNLQSYLEEGKIFYFYNDQVIFIRKIATLQWILSFVRIKPYPLNQRMCLQKKIDASIYKHFLPRISNFNGIGKYRKWYRSLLLIKICTRFHFYGQNIRMNYLCWMSR